MFLFFDDPIELGCFLIGFEIKMQTFLMGLNKNAKFVDGFE